MMPSLLSVLPPACVSVLSVGSVYTWMRWYLASGRLAVRLAILKKKIETPWTAVTILHVMYMYMYARATNIARLSSRRVGLRFIRVGS